MNLENINPANKIQYLYLAGNHLNNIEILDNFPNLLYADLSNNPINKISELKKCTSLKELKLDGTALDSKDILIGKEGYWGLKKRFSKP